MAVTAAKVSIQMQELAKRVDNYIEELAGERCGFMLLVWAGNDVNYVSTDNDRDRAAKAMRELIAKWESGLPDTPSHKRH